MNVQYISNKTNVDKKEFLYWQNPNNCSLTKCHLKVLIEEVNQGKNVAILKTRLVKLVFLSSDSSIYHLKFWRNHLHESTILRKFPITCSEDRDQRSDIEAGVLNDRREEESILWLGWWLPAIQIMKNFIHHHHHLQDGSSYQPLLHLHGESYHVIHHNPGQEWAKSQFQ